MIGLFLDDKRVPGDFFGYDTLGIDWIIVKDFAEFEDYINKNGIPLAISFDHDLVDEHYDIDWSDVYLNNQMSSSVPTGLDCLKSLIQRLLMTKPSGTDMWPICGVHSMNPVGREQIVRLLETWSFPRLRLDI